MQAIRQVVPGATITGARGRRTSFEVTIDGKHLAWSKLENGKFPDNQALAQSIAEYAKTGEPMIGWASLTGQKTQPHADSASSSASAAGQPQQQSTSGTGGWLFSRLF